MADVRHISLECPTCGGSATVIVTDVTSEEGGHLRWLVQKYRCPQACTVPDVTILEAIGLE